MWTWFTWLTVAVVIAAVAALTGIQPKGARPVAQTRLIGVARLVLITLLIILAYFAFRARSG